MRKKYELEDLKKEWPKIRLQLLKVSQDAVDLAKKGEKELVRFSQKSKLHIDATALNIKQEHLYHLIGKEYVRARCPAKPTVKLKKLIEEFTCLQKEFRTLKRRIRTDQSPRPSSAAGKTRRKDQK